MKKKSSKKSVSPAAKSGSHTRTTRPKKSAARSSVAPRVASSLRPKPAATSITARVDVGFGNHLYLRGAGAGLSWDHGMAMDCVAPDRWVATLKDASHPVAFKVLINDETWCQGTDYLVEPGRTVTVSPSF